MKSKWKTKRLGDISTINYGYTAKASFNKADSLFLRITDIQDNFVDWKTVPYCSISEIDYEKYKLIDNDIVFARTGATTGKSYLIKKPPKSVAASYLIRLRLTDCDILPEFIAKYFQTPTYWNDISLGIVGSAQGGFNASKLSDLIIPVPPIEEQKRIVEILDKAFEGIAQAEANTRRNLINARELFDSYLEKILTDCRWETKQISECFRVKSGNFLPKNKMNNFGEFKVYGGNGVAGQHDQFNLEGKNILIGRVGAKCGNIKTINAKIWLTDNALYISEFLVDFDLDFLSFVLERADLGKTANQTAQPVISYTTIKSVFISYPKATEQQKTIVKKVYKIKDCLQDLEKIYQRKLEAIAELKQSILEKAFTGQLSQ
jgi:type I restriction enzyme S subunit